MSLKSPSPTLASIAAPWLKGVLVGALACLAAPAFAQSAEPGFAEGPLQILHRVLSLPDTGSAQAAIEELQLSRSPTGRGAPGRPHLVSARKEAKGLVFTVEGDRDGQLQELRTSFFSDEDRQANCSKKSEVLKAVPGLSRIIFDLYTEPVQAKPDSYKVVLPGGARLGVSFGPDKCLNGFSVYRKPAIAIGNTPPLNNLRAQEP